VKKRCSISLSYFGHRWTRILPLQPAMLDKNFLASTPVESSMPESWSIKKMKPAELPCGTQLSSPTPSPVKVYFILFCHMGPTTMLVHCSKTKNPASFMTRPLKHRIWYVTLWVPLCDELFVACCLSIRWTCTAQRVWFADTWLFCLCRNVVAPSSTVMLLRQLLIRTLGVLEVV